MFVPILAEILKEEKEEKSVRWQEHERIKEMCNGCKGFILITVRPEGKLVYSDGFTELEAIGLLEQAKKGFINIEVPTITVRTK